MTRFRIFLLTFVFAGMTVVGALAQDTDAGATNAVNEVGMTADGESADAATPAADEKTSMDMWVTYLEQGGKTMIFLGLLSVLGLACALERFVNLRKNRIVPEGFSVEVMRLWKDDDFEGVETFCAKNNSMLARVTENMLEHRSSRDYGEVKMFAEDKAGRELRLENRKSMMLSSVATLAPLLGLFGTVVGLLGAFSTVAAVGEMGDPSLLADDIGKALVTTVAGLAIAMPALFVYHLVKNRLNLFAVLLEEEVSDLVNHLFVQQPR